MDSIERRESEISVIMDSFKGGLFSIQRGLAEQIYDKQVTYRKSQPYQSELTAKIANILHENTSLDPGESLVAADLITKELFDA